MYDPTIGRWISEDPLEFEAGDANLYRYLENKPTKQRDPSGLFPLPFFGGPESSPRQPQPPANPNQLITPVPAPQPGTGFGPYHLPFTNQSGMFGIYSLAVPADPEAWRQILGHSHFYLYTQDTSPGWISQFLGLPGHNSTLITGNPFTSQFNGAQSSWLFGNPQSPLFGVRLGINSDSDMETVCLTINNQELLNGFGLGGFGNALGVPTYTQVGASQSSGIFFNSVFSTQFGNLAAGFQSNNNAVNSGFSSTYQFSESPWTSWIPGQVSFYSGYTTGNRHRQSFGAFIRFSQHFGFGVNFGTPTPAVQAGVQQVIDQFQGGAQYQPFPESGITVHFFH